MTRSTAMLVVAGLITSGAASTASAAEQRSGCVACHLDEAMLVQNLSATKAKKSALQSGAG